MSVYLSRGSVVESPDPYMVGGVVGSIKGSNGSWAKHTNTKTTSMFPSRLVRGFGLGPGYIRRAGCAEILPPVGALCRCLSQRDRATFAQQSRQTQLCDRCARALARTDWGLARPSLRYQLTVWYREWRIHSGTSLLTRENCLILSRKRERERTIRILFSEAWFVDLCRDWGVVLYRRFPPGSRIALRACTHVEWWGDHRKLMRKGDHAVACARLICLFR